MDGTPNQNVSGTGQPLNTALFGGTSQQSRSQQSAASRSDGRGSRSSRDPWFLRYHR